MNKDNGHYLVQRDLFVERGIVKLNHELFHATSIFSDTNIISSGRMVVVYSRMLNIMGKYHTIAMKRFKDEIIGSETPIAKIKALVVTKHCNLVCLLGYYWAPRAMALVMEWMPNQTWAGDIHEKILISSRCSKIARGIAEGMKYLHHECL